MALFWQLTNGKALMHKMPACLSRELRVLSPFFRWEEVKPHLLTLCLDCCFSSHSSGPALLSPYIPVQFSLQKPGTLARDLRSPEILLPPNVKLGNTEPSGALLLRPQEELRTLGWSLPTPTPRHWCFFWFCLDPDFFSLPPPAPGGKRACLF